VKKATSPQPTRNPAPSQRHVERDEDDDHGDNGDALDPESLIDQAANEAKEFTNPDPGIYSAIINQIRVLEPTDKGQSIQMQFVLYTPDAENTIMRFSKFFKMLGEDLRTPDEWGPLFYARFMGKLGYEKGNRGKEAREEINEQKPGVVVKITPQKNNDDFVNLDITGILDDEHEDIIAIRDELGKQPY